MIETVDRSLLKSYIEKVDEMIRYKETEKILPSLQENLAIIKFDNDLMIVWYLAMMTQKEIAAGVPSVFEKEASLEEILNRYRQLKFYLRRIENNILDDANDFLCFLSERKVSEYELMGVIDNSIYYKEKVWAYFQR